VSPPGHPSAESQIVAAQMGRVPRDPWRVGSHCQFGYPATIVSPSVLADATPFPNLAWLTCPWLVLAIGELESAGEIARWAQLAREDADVAASLQTTDSHVRELRAMESGGSDACSSVGIAGQRDPLGVKCLHAHVALALIGVHDPIGEAILSEVGTVCPDERCARLKAATGEDADD